MYIGLYESLLTTILNNGLFIVASRYSGALQMYWEKSIVVTTMNTFNVPSHQRSPNLCNQGVLAETLHWTRRLPIKQIPLTGYYITTLDNEFEMVCQTGKHEFYSSIRK